MGVTKSNTKVLLTFRGSRPFQKRVVDNKEKNSVAETTLLEDGECLTNFSP